MAEAHAVEWPQEEIPDGDTLFLRVHHSNIKGDDITPGAFKPHEGGVSTDWSKYANAEQTRMNAAANNKDPANYGVVSLGVGPVRSIPRLAVRHTPLLINRAHTDIEFAEEDYTEMRVKLGRLWTWCIKRSGA